MRFSDLTVPVLLLASAMFPLGVHAAGLRHAATQADRELLNHAYYCETGKALAALDAGANIDVVSSGGFTPLMTAALNDCDELAAALIARGAALDPKNSDGQTALDIAHINSPNIADRIEAAGGGGPGVALPGPQARANMVAAAFAPKANGGQANAQPIGGPAEWPPLGYYRPGQKVLHTATGLTWTPGVVDRVMPDYGYVVGTDVPYRSGVAGVTREPFWTAWFFGDWRIRIPSAYTAVLEGNMIHETVTAGMDLPPLHIDADGTYVWRVGTIGNEQVIEGRWEPKPDAPGVILRNGEFGADWLVANMTDNTDDYERIKLYTPKHTGYQGRRLE